MSSDPVSEEDDVEVTEAPRQQSRRRWLIVVLVVIAVAGLALGVQSWVKRSRARGLTMPAMDLTGLDAAIVAAVTTARQAVEDKPHDADTWGHLGMVLYAHEHVAPAVECFANAEKLADDDYRWPYLRGMVLAEESAAQGLPYVRRAVALAPPEDASVRLRLAELLFDVRELKESEAIFREVLSVEMDNVRAKYGLARVLAVSGDPQEALRWASGAVRSLPDVRATHELMAKLFHRTGNTEAAQMQMQLVDRLPHKNLMWPDKVLEDVILLRVDAHWRSEEALRYDMLGQPEKFVQALQHLVAEYPDDPLYWVQFGRALVQVRNYTMARRMLEGGVRRHPDAVEIRFVWGLAHQKDRDYAKAVEIYLDVVQRKPDYPEAWNALASCQRQLNQDEQAVASYRQVLRYEAFDVDAHIGLADLLWKQGQRDEAAQYLKMALELAPDHPDALAVQQRMR